MLIGIIKEQTNNDNYYIHLDKKDNHNEISIVHVNNRVLETLSKDKARNLLNTMLSSNLIFKGKENDYDIYLDEANNKRYFKDGKENYLMFLENNGTDAVKYITKKNKLDRNKSYQIIAGGLIFTVLVSTIAVAYVAISNTKYTKEQAYLLTDTNPVTVEEMIDLVCDSPNLNANEREILCNEIFFSFVLENSQGKPREYHIRNSLKELNIKTFRSEDFAGALGYYNPTDINTIHVLNSTVKNKSQYDDVIAHEFVHLLQSSNQYYYIQEASAEMMEYEFFEQPCDGYGDIVRRTKVLMEIIGPDPVIKCNFSGDTTSFEDSIRQYLSEEDANRMFKLLGTPATELYKTVEKTRQVNEGIDELLAKMYTNKTGKDIKDDEMIQFIYKVNPTQRIYFNANNEAYYEKCELPSKRVDIDELNIDEVINSNKVSYYQHSQKVSKVVGNNKYKYYQNQIVKNINNIPISPDKYVTIAFKDGTWGTIRYDIKKGKWSNVAHYKLENRHEQSIPKKFPSQARKPYTFDERENEKIEVKSM